MKIFTARQIKEADAFTIHQEGISTLDLMERAANACLQWIRENYGSTTSFLTISGMGNNGGDGLALTRMLLQEGFKAKAVILKHADTFTEDTAHNFRLLHQLSPQSVQLLEPGNFITEIPENIVLIDALFGSGLNRAIDGWIADFISACNELSNQKIAIDLPSGLPADSLPEADAAVFRATHTLSFQFYKRSFFHPEAALVTGSVHLLDIKISTSFIAGAHTQYYVLDQFVAGDLYQKRHPFGHKGTFGKAVVAGGSYGRIGAISLCAQAALRSGAGLVFVLAPDCGYQVLQIAAQEALFISGGQNEIEKLQVPDGKIAVGIGPGMGTATVTQAAFSRFLASNKQPLVLDADALNLIAEQQDLLQLLPAGSILCPHPKEFERLFGKTSNSMSQTELARAKAMKHNIFIILKGHHTAVLSPSGTCWYNNNGNAGMATGGSGDVLAGIITGLLAQGYNPQAASLLAVYLHGKSGDIAASRTGMEALIARDLVRFLGQAFLSLKDAGKA